MHRDIPEISSQLDRYSLKVLRAEDVVWKSGIGHSKEPDLFVEVSVGNVLRRTKVVKKTLAPIWNEDIPLLTATENSYITLKLLHDSTFRNVLLGSTVISASELAATSKASAACLLLRSSKKTECAKLFLRLEATEQNANLTAETHKATQDVASIAHSPSMLPITGAPDVLGAVQAFGLYDSIETVIGRLDSLKAILDGFASIHPFVSAAWAVASALYGAITKQIRIDQAVVNLAGKLAESLDFALDAHPLRDRFRSLESTVARLFNQITECCLFIREYTGNGFVGRIFRQGDQRKIDAFVQSLGELKLAIDQGVNLNTAIVTVRIASQVNQLYLRSLLEPDTVDVYGRRPCQDGTRVSMLQDVTKWLLTESSQNVLWLYGAAGSGKSTISRSIQDYMLSLSRLGAYLCFERGKSTPNNVIKTIAYQLASYDSHIAEAISNTLGDSDIKATPLQNQFDVLLARSLTTAAEHVTGPIVIILDALDECGDSRSRKDLLGVMAGLTKLPCNYRFLITGRPEADLHKTFMSSAWSAHVRPVELDCDSNETKNDVLNFLRHELHELSEPYEDTELLSEWHRNVEKLAEASSGLFISASTAVKMIEVSDNPFATLRELVSGEIHINELDTLYTTVLINSGVQWEKETSVGRFKDIVSFMILRKAPLDDRIIDGILGLPLEYRSRFILEKVRPLIGYEKGKPLYFRHTTISDYFIASTSSDHPWSLDINSFRYTLTNRCFISMQNSLKFNIGGLLSSCCRNDTVNGLEQTLASDIMPHLRYASFYWASHLCDCDDTNAMSLLKALNDFLYERLLFWVEALSLLKFKGIDKILCDASRWLNTFPDSDTRKFLKDTRKLLNIFYEAIVESTPHIYVSMLPLMHLESTTAAHYYHRFPSSGIEITHQGVKKPSPRLKTLEAEGTRFMSAIAFSPTDKTRLVSGDGDGAIRVWDIESGEVIYVPSTKHGDAVSCVEFTHDGKRIVSGSRDSSLSLWHIDDKTEKKLGSHSTPIIAVAISFDDAFIASGCEDGSIGVWDLRETQAVLQDGPSHIFSVLSVAFHPSAHSRWIASSSLDGTLRLWNITSDETKSFALADDESWIQTVAFSPDGDSLLCGSDSGHIRIRSSKDGSVLRALTGHSGSIYSLFCSPTTRYLVSGSQDSTLRIWDIEAGLQLVEPFVEESQISSVTWSCDGQHIACVAGRNVSIYDATDISTDSYWNSTTDPISINSPLTAAIISSDNTWIAAGSTDGSVRVWRKNPGDTGWGAPQLLSGHKDHIWYTDISPDNKRFATASADSTIRIWSVEESTTEHQVIKVGHGVRCVAFSPVPIRGDLASAALDGTITIWDSDSGESLRTIGQFPHHATSVAYSADGTSLAAGFWDGIVRVWELTTHSLVRSLDGYNIPPDHILSLAFSSDGKVAAGSQRGSVRIWDWRTGTVLIDMPDAHTGQVFSLSFSSDSEYLLSSCWNNAVKLWNASTGVCLTKRHHGHTQRVYSSIFSPDDSMIISSSRDATVRLWDTATFASTVQVLSEDGWLVDERDRLLLWIPPSLRPSLLWNSSQLEALGIAFTTRVDFSNFREDGWRDNSFKTV